jgi:4a-hydroxytetrahydrobiopterin dehydratase
MRGFFSVYIPMEETRVLTREQIRDELENLSGWEQRGDKLAKGFRKKNFVEVARFVYELAPVFEKLNHHPGISMSHDTVWFELTTGEAGGKITDRDIRAAQAIEGFSEE